MAASVTTTLLLLAATMSAAVSCVAAAFVDAGVPAVSFSSGFTMLFGEANMARSFSSGSGADDELISITLDRRSGSGFISKHYYHHGHFSADIKLPSGHTAGVVVAFYLSNADAFPDTHDELDFEFLGDRAGRPWRLQTNVYGNGSTSRGREERYLLPFDPAAAAHNFAVSWSPRAVVFSVDGVPIREVLRHGSNGNGDMGGDYPSKPMAVYATIWDGSTWATENGKYKVGYEHGPFTAQFSRLVLHGCAADGGGCAAMAGPETETMTVAPWERAAMRRWRRRQTLYTVCYDEDRYPAAAGKALPECETNAAERRMFERWGESKWLRQLQLQGQGQAPPLLVSLQQAD